MENKKNIEQLFRSNEHKLHEAPSSSAWDRLEHKLDGAKPHRAKRFSIFRLASIAASIIFLIAVAWGASTLLPQEESAMPLADLQWDDDLSADKVDTDEAFSIVHVANRKADQTIEEGKPGKRIVLQNALAKQMDYTRRRPSPEKAVPEDSIQ